MMLAAEEESERIVWKTNFRHRHFFLLHANIKFNNNAAKLIVKCFLHLSLAARGILY
jgi:hypothetical protein